MCIIFQLGDISICYGRNNTCMHSCIHIQCKTDGKDKAHIKTITHNLVNSPKLLKRYCSLSTYFPFLYQIFLYQIFLCQMSIRLVQQNNYCQQCICTETTYLTFYFFHVTPQLSLFRDNPALQDKLVISL